MDIMLDAFDAPSPEEIKEKKKLRKKELVKGKKPIYVDRESIGEQSGDVANRPNKRISPKFNINSGIDQFVSKGYRFGSFFIKSVDTPSLCFRLSKQEYGSHGKLSKKFNTDNNDPGNGADFPIKDDTISDFGFRDKDKFHMFLHSPVEVDDSLESLIFELEFDSDTMLSKSDIRMTMSSPSAEDLLKVRAERLASRTTRPDFEAYRIEVERLTKLTLQAVPHKIKNHELSTQPGMTVDHIFSVYHGYRYGVPAHVIAHQCNLQWLVGTGPDGNFSKNKASWQTPFELVKAYCEATGEDKTVVASSINKELYFDDQL